MFDHYECMITQEEKDLLKCRTADQGKVMILKEHLNHLVISSLIWCFAAQKVCTASFKPSNYPECAFPLPSCPPSPPQYAPQHAPLPTLLSPRPSAYMHHARPHFLTQHKVRDDQSSCNDHTDTYLLLCVRLLLLIPPLSLSLSISVSRSPTLCLSVSQPICVVITRAVCGCS